MEHKHTTGNQSANPTFTAYMLAFNGFYNVTGTGNYALIEASNASYTSRKISTNTDSMGPIMGKGRTMYNDGNDNNGRLQVSGTVSGNHTHSTTSLTNLAGTAITNTGDVSQTHTHKVTAAGTISGGVYKFTGTDGTTGTKGDGQAHNNMPPYVVKFCWERTA